MTLATRPVSKTACDRCKATRHLIVGDGPVICYPCIGLLTDAAADPIVVSPRLREVLADLHSDIVKLEDSDGVLSWSWLGWQ